MKVSDWSTYLELLCNNHLMCNVGQIIQNGACLKTEQNTKNFMSHRYVLFDNEILLIFGS